MNNYMKNEYRRVNAKSLRTFVENLYAQYGLKKRDSETVADVLLAADLRGIDSHGVSRLVWYDEWISKGLINLKPDISVVRETQTTAAVDGDNGLGMLVSVYAMKIAIKKAKEYGSGFVSVGKSNHFGIAGYYSMMALKEEMIGISMTNMIPIIVPTYGKKKMLGTNPLSFSIPTKDQNPFVLDMATSAVSGGKLEIAMREEREIPIGLVIDNTGKATTNPKAPWQGGALLPLGGEGEKFGGHKGYGLAALVNALCGALSGSIYGLEPNESELFGKPLSVTANVGHFFGALRIDGFRPKDKVLNDMDLMLKALKESEPARGYKKVYVAGEREHLNEEDRIHNGIPLHIKTVDDLIVIGNKYKVNYSFLQGKRYANAT